MSAQEIHGTAGEAVNELKAAVAARRELGPEMEDQVLESFLARIEGRVQELAKGASRKSAPAKHTGGNTVNPAAVAVPTMALAIPVTAIAGGIAGGPGVVAAMVAVVLINLLFYIDRWVMKP